MWPLLKFLFMAVGISLSGVMAPGPMTTAAIATGARNRHAGAIMALGHAVIELPLMILIVSGMGVIFKYEQVKIGIGLAGGAFLVLMASAMLRDLKKNINLATKPNPKGPLATGIILTAGNPYFLLWWATIGLALATQAVDLGAFAFILFALIHWLCDLVWLEILSWASFKGTELLGARTQRFVLKICAIALFFFAAKFLYDAGTSLHILLTTNS